MTIPILLGDPDSEQVALRGAGEGIAEAMVAKIRNVIVLYRLLLDVPTVEFRLHTTVLYDSIYCADEEEGRQPACLWQRGSAGPRSAPPTPRRRRPIRHLRRRLRARLDDRQGPCLLRPPERPGFRRSTPVTSRTTHRAGRGAQPGGIGQRPEGGHRAVWLPVSF